jgi:hypothetical protein
MMKDVESGNHTHSYTTAATTATNNHHHIAVSCHLLCESYSTPSWTSAVHLCAQERTHTPQQPRANADPPPLRPPITATIPCISTYNVLRSAQPLAHMPASDRLHKAAHAMCGDHTSAGLLLPAAAQTQTCVFPPAQQLSHCTRDLFQPRGPH